MEITWFGIGFLIGMVLWMPFILDTRTDERLARAGLLAARVCR